MFEEITGRYPRFSRIRYTSPYYFFLNGVKTVILPRKNKPDLFKQLHKPKYKNEKPLSKQKNIKYFLKPRESEQKWNTENYII